MPPARLPLHSRVGEFFGVDDPWQRPRPQVSRGDVVLALATAAHGLVSLELLRSMGLLETVDQPVWLQVLATVSASALLTWRRRWPLSIAVVAAVHMFVVGVTMAPVMSQFTLQVVYFIAFFAAVAWSRDRRLMLGVVGSIIVGMFVWIAWQFLLGSGVQEIIDDTRGVERSGLVGPVTATVALTVLINVIYFGGAVIAGQLDWRSARQRAQLETASATIATQSETLQRRAVTDERLRIARELHDVVGHHISVIGIQAAAARRVLTRDPDAAATALAAIETSSRDGVTQMRSLLGTLRDPEDAEPRPPRRAGCRSPGSPTCPPSWRSGEPRASPPPTTSSSPAPARPTGCRRRPGWRSTGSCRRPWPTSPATPPPATPPWCCGSRRTAPRPHAEVEVLDDGRPRGRSSGSGLGHLGVRERAASQRGEAEIGPRPTGGYRVRVRIPLGDNSV
jgi:signal transduction histidine kinase